MGLVVTLSPSLNLGDPLMKPVMDELPFLFHLTKEGTPRGATGAFFAGAGATFFNVLVPLFTTGAAFFNVLVPLFTTGAAFFSVLVPLFTTGGGLFVSEGVDALLGARKYL